MLIAVLLLCGLNIIALTVGFLYARKRIKETLRGYTSNFTDFFVKADSEGITEFDKMAGFVSQKIVSDITVSLQAKSMAANSHISRQANLLAEDMIQDDVSRNNPVLGMLLEQFPSVKKRLAKNPAARQAIMPIIQNLTDQGGGKTPEASSNGHTNDMSWIKRLE